MKKYFMKNTEDELQFGDMIELDFVGEENGVTKHCHMECKFVPELVDTLLENEVIEVKEFENEEEEEGLEFADDGDNFIDDIYEDIEALEKRIDALEDRMKNSSKILDKVYDKVNAMAELIKSSNAKNNAKKPAAK